MSDPQSPAAPQPGYPQPTAPGYPQPGASPVGYPSATASGYPAPYTAARTGSSGLAARIGFIIALATALVGMVFTIAARFLIASQGFALFSLVSLLTGIVAGLGYAAALVFGIVGARGDRNRVLAGIAIGIGGAGLLGILSGWVMDLISRILIH